MPKERNHETTPEEIAAVQAAFVSDQGVYPNPLQVQAILNTNGGSVEHATRLFRETLDLFPGATIGEKVYAEVDQDHARGQRAATAWLNGTAPLTPGKPLNVQSDGAVFAARLGDACIAAGLSVADVVAALRPKAA